MEVKHIKFPSIKQFRTVVKNVVHMNAYIGQDENDEAVFDFLKPKPIVKAHGTVKLHGTNAGVSVNCSDIWFQSRENIITIGKDNAGFAAFGEARRVVFAKLVDKVAAEFELELYSNTITLYGEWCGGSIQGGVGLNKLEKMFVIFGAKVTPEDGAVSYWVPSYNLKSEEHNIYNIEDFPKFEIEVDFNNPEIAQNKMLEIMLEVEKDCPVSRHFLPDSEDTLIGEGVVWTIFYRNNTLRWKIKGEKHSNSKDKTPKVVDLDKLKAIDKVVEDITHEWRFVQGMKEIFGPDYENTIDRKKFGDYMKWIYNDTIKEEMDIIEESGFDVKEVMNRASKKAKDYFFAVEQL
jgi:hypothetical protein